MTSAVDEWADATFAGIRSDLHLRLEVAVSGLREVAGTYLDDTRLRALIAELSEKSQRFSEPWARADVGYRTGILQLRHPKVVIFIWFAPGSAFRIPAGRFC